LLSLRALQDFFAIFAVKGFIPAIFFEAEALRLPDLC
jgi:hypothetical protein